MVKTVGSIKTERDSISKVNQYLNGLESTRKYLSSMNPRGNLSNDSKMFLFNVYQRTVEEIEELFPEGIQKRSIDGKWLGDDKVNEVSTVIVKGLDLADVRTDYTDFLEKGVISEVIQKEKLEILLKGGLN
ncbi:MAG: hypothetical protein KC516_01080 [Nanoarchaeota archaeon]|nr:hypothetical protein [Nanoarchaeota archaeon]